MDDIEVWAIYEERGRGMGDAEERRGGVGNAEERGREVGDPT